MIFRFIARNSLTDGCFITGSKSYGCTSGSDGCTSGSLGVITTSDVV